MKKYTLYLSLLTMISSSVLAFENTSLNLPDHCVTQAMKKQIALTKKMFSSPSALWELAKTKQSYYQVYDKNFVFYGNGSRESATQFRNHMLQNMKHWKTSTGNTIHILNIMADKNQVMVRLRAAATAQSGHHYALDSFELLQFKQGKVYRWYETAYPDWRQIIKKEGENV